jgi:hypothetical protein
MRTVNVLLLGLAVATASGLSLHGLTNHAFWDDEANTGLFARNFLETGTLTAWDGRNVIGYRGGAELDDRLVNVYMPPLQYWVAALGMAGLGESTLGARLPFVLAGVAALVPLALWSRSLLGPGFPWALPSLLLSLSPVYLLYIRNCRYYALAVLFTLLVLASWSATPRGRGSFLVSAAVAAASTAALWLSHYPSAASLLVGLPLLLVFERFRGRRQLIKLGLVYATSGLVGAWIFFVANPFARQVATPDATPPEIRKLILLAWHLEGLATFEFVPVLLAAALVLPFALSRFAPLRSLAFRGLAVAGMIGLGCVATAALSPQPVNAEIMKVADMRQQVPVIALGAVLAAVALGIVWRGSPWMAAPLGALLVFSNVLHLGFLARPQEGFARRGVACTLCDYVWENAHDYASGTEKLIEYLRGLPAETVVFIRPDYLVYSPMFYVPRLRYAGQLARDKRIAPELAAQLPDHVFAEGGRVEKVILAVGGRVRGHFNVGPASRLALPRGSYRAETRLEVYPYDRTRPELPWHSFSPADFAGFTRWRFVVYEVAPLEPEPAEDAAARNTQSSLAR